MRLAPRFLLALCAACAKPSSTVYIAPSPQNIVGSYEEGSGATRSLVFYLANHSSVPIVVTSVTLRQCENVRQSCEPSKTNIRIAPGGRAPIKRVEPRNASLPFRFYPSYAWKAESGKEVLQAMSESGSEVAKARLESAQIAEAWGHARPAGITVFNPAAGYQDIRAFKGMEVSLRPIADSVMFPVGVKRPVNIPVFLVSAQGIRIGQVMGVLWEVQPDPSVEIVGQGTITPSRTGRTTAVFRLPEVVAKDWPTPIAPTRITLIFLNTPPRVPRDPRPLPQGS